MTTQKERLVEVELASSEKVLVRRLSPVTRQAMVSAAQALYPDPDPALYIKPLSEIAPNALEGATLSAEQNPVYIEKKKLIDTQRTLRLIDMAFQSGVVTDTPEGREATIERYAERIAVLRELLPGKLPDDAWAATVMHGLITVFGDRGKIFNAAWDTLSAGEVRFALASFRRDVQRSGFALADGNRGTPGAATPDRSSED